MNTSLPIILPAPSKYENHINSGATIKGKFEFSGTALIEGIIYGDVEGFGKLVDTISISTTGKVFGSIRCAMASITGAVVGNIYAKQISLEANCTVQGDIYYETLGINPNAVINGRLIQQSEQNASTVTQTMLPAPYTYNSTEQLVVGEYSNDQPVYIPSGNMAPAHNSTNSNSSEISAYSPKRIWRKK